ncbi:hypothetical protein [uncultured Flavobacterium sp.]|uniref:hypothetical protein n=1 Tax=uncultured Flavobacterium sp. TaxID=165435 RepID=UPI0030ED5A59|tara:strand:+ start:9178 stop:9729 length:552 start_codon:yes stop_codon:yes gene_type:complete
MVLTNKQVEVTPKGFMANRGLDSFMVLNTESILHEDQIQLFGFSIEILNLLRVINKANELSKGFKSEFRIPTEIFYKVIDNVMSNKPFTDTELESYIKAEQIKEEFLTFSRSLADFDNDFYLPFEIDYILLGVDMKLYDKLDEAEKDVLGESYGDLHCEVIFKNIEISDFIMKAKKLIADIAH